jgi:hypothetical protein
LSHLEQQTCVSDIRRIKTIYFFQANISKCHKDKPSLTLAIPT